jgi:hypothetical protein
VASREGDEVVAVLVRFEPNTTPQDVLLTAKSLPPGRSQRMAGYLLGSKHANSPVEKGGFWLGRGKDGDAFGIKNTLEGLSTETFKLTAHDEGQN